MLRGLVIAIALCGCRDRGLEELKELRRELCACDTIACGEAVLERLPQQQAATDHRARAIAGEMLDCMAELYAADRPSSDPDEPREATSPGSADPASAGTP